VFSKRKTNPMFAGGALPAQRPQTGSGEKEKEGEERGRRGGGWQGGRGEGEGPASQETRKKVERFVFSFSKEGSQTSSKKGPRLQAVEGQILNARGGPLDAHKLRLRRRGMG